MKKAIYTLNADRGQAPPVYQGAHTSLYSVTEARRRVDTASLSPDQRPPFPYPPKPHPVTT